MTSYFNELMYHIKEAVYDGPHQHDLVNRLSWCFSPTLKYNYKREVVEHVNTLSTKERKVAYEYYITEIKKVSDEVAEAWEVYDMNILDPIQGRLHSDDYQSLTVLLESVSDFITEKIQPSLPRPKKSDPSYEEVFLNPKHPDIVKQTFDNKRYTINGKWVGVSKSATELREAVYSLRELGIIDHKYKTKLVAAFFEEFKVGPEKLTKRSYTEEIDSHDRGTFDQIFTKIF